MLIAGVVISPGLLKPAYAQIEDDLPPPGLPASPGSLPARDDWTQSPGATAAQQTEEPPFTPDPSDEMGAQPAVESVELVPLGVPPVKLMIPSLGVEAQVEAVGDDPDGAMSTPTNPDDVAWYELGPGMGVPGNAVFAAHVNWAGRLRPFGRIHLLEPGDVIQVIDEEGRGFEYAVESSHWVRAEGAPVDEIFAQPSAPMVTLITCGGEYVAATREYLDRLIVKAHGIA